MPFPDPRFAVLVVVLLAALTPRAHAQTRVALIVPEGTPPALVDAVLIELQLDGHQPVLSWRSTSVTGLVVDLFAHTDAPRAVVLDPRGRVIVADRGGRIAEASLGGRLATRYPRVVAMIASDLASRMRPEQPVVVSVELPRVQSTDPTGALTPPTASPPSRRLGSPRASARNERLDDVTDLEGAAPREPWPGWLRVLTEIGIGMAGAAVLGVPLAAALDQPAGGWVYGFALGGPVGFSLGAWLGGVLAGGEGNIWWTLFGGVLGALIAGGLLLTGVAVDRDTGDEVDSAFTFLGGVALFALPTTFAVLGFELSQP